MRREYFVIAFIISIAALFIWWANGLAATVAKSIVPTVAASTDGGPTR